VAAAITKARLGDPVLRALHATCFAGDHHEDYHQGTWWLAKDAGKAVGFAGIRPCDSWPEAAYFSRVGVLSSHRGRGLQARFMRTLERAARSQGFTHIVSTTYENPASANNFIRCGYRTYLPVTPWGAPGTIYWIKQLC
jgi:GNAT superfamily N-acetyltransferase